jgi:surfactin synthase thioesterase subunit
MLELVTEAFENAAENGHTLKELTDMEVVHDMIECGAIDPEVYNDDEVLDAVQAYRRLHP